MSPTLRARPLALSGAALAALAPASAGAADLQVKVEVPRLQVAEYRKPYIAFWLRKPDESSAGTVALWYDPKNREEMGQKWLKDLRLWWRKEGRGLRFPIDGLTGATRPPGVQSLSAPDGVLAKLAPGRYELVAEAARESGGHEVVAVPFQWPPRAVQTASAKGRSELGAVTLTARP